MDSRCPDLDQVSFSVLSSKTGQASGACDPKTQLRGWLTISTAPAPLFCVLPLSSDLLSPRILTAVGAWSVGIGSLLWMSPGAQVLVPPMFCDLLCCVCRPELLQPAVSGAPSPGMGALCGAPRLCCVHTTRQTQPRSLPGLPGQRGCGAGAPGWREVPLPRDPLTFLLAFGLACFRLLGQVAALPGKDLEICAVPLSGVLWVKHQFQGLPRNAP